MLFNDSSRAFGFIRLLLIELLLSEEKKNLISPREHFLRSLIFSVYNGIKYFLWKCGIEGDSRESSKWCQSLVNIYGVKIIM